MFLINLNPTLPYLTHSHSSFNTINMKFGKSIGTILRTATASLGLRVTHRETCSRKPGFNVPLSFKTELGVSLVQISSFKGEK